VKHLLAGSALLLSFTCLACNQLGSQHASAAGGSASAAPAAKPADPAKAQPSFSNYFNSARAWEDMRQQMGYGFRVAGSPAAGSCRGYLVGQLKQSCASVDLQYFTIKRPAGDLRMCNIIGHINPQAERRLLLMGHWDTRPTADMNPPGLRDQPIPGADDGASETAVLLELARVFHAHPPKVGVDILLTDGEDYGPQMTMMFLGAKYFADQLTPDQVRAYNYGILLDMIGDSDLDIHPESQSENVASVVYQEALEISHDLGYNNFKRGGEYEIYDDHLPLIEKGIRVYDFIDFNFPAWHTTNDTLDKCSPDSLEAVGRTVENMVYLVPGLYSKDKPLTPRVVGSGWR
jgi:hypothetical protein